MLDNLRFTVTELGALLVGGAGLGWALLRFVIPTLIQYLSHEKHAGILRRAAYLVALPFGPYSALQVISHKGEIRYSGQQALASDLKLAIPTNNIAEFSRNKTFLDIVNDTGNRELYPLGYLSLGVITFLEVFSMLFLVVDARLHGTMTNQVTTYLTAFTSLILAAAFVYFMHEGGVSLRRNRHLKALLTTYHSMPSNAQSGVIESFPAYKSIEYGSSQDEDQNQPEVIRIAKRITHSSSWMFRISVVLMILIATMMFWISAADVLSPSSTAANQTSQTQSFQVPFSGDPSSPNQGVKLALELPQFSDGQSEEASKTRNSESGTALSVVATVGHLIPFLFVSVLFLFTQILGLFCGFKYCFLADDSKNAKEENLNVNSWESFAAKRSDALTRCDALLATWRSKNANAILKSTSNLSPASMKDYFPELANL